MEIVVRSRGTKLKKEGRTLLIETVDKDRTKVSLMQLETLIIYPDVSISSSALLFAMEKKSEVIFVDDYGFPKGRLWNSEFNSTSYVRRKQYEIFGTEKGSEIGKKYICTKLRGILEILKEFNIDDETSIKTILKSIDSIEKTRGEPKEIRDKIMGYEGSAGRVFYKKISKIFPEKYSFEKRELQNAKDEFNIILNYYYGILYRICEGELIKKGLDPFLGIFHSDSYNKKSFLFDYIEEFRPWAILRAAKFIKNKHIRVNHFDDAGLTNEGKKEIIIFFNIFLDGKERYMDKMYKRREIIGRKVIELVKELKGDDNEISFEL